MRVGPDKINAGAKSEHMLYFPDIMSTLAEISGTESPETDGLSILPTLLGAGKQQQHTHFYWEYQGQTAVRKGNWKAYKSKSSSWELYAISKDKEKRRMLLQKMKTF